MPACSWCGDRHTNDRLCQRAQRGLTRRSFCFLFGAGVTGLALSPSLSFTEDLTHVQTRVHVVADAYTTIQQSLGAPTTATFRTRDRALRIGRPITVSLPDIGVLFNGTVDQIVINGDGLREVHAVDAAEFAARRPEDYAAVLGSIQ